MISIKVSDASIKHLISELNGKVEALSAINEPIAKSDIASAVFTLATKSFIKRINATAMANPKKYHHIYEWNKTGVDQARLFKIIKESTNSGSLRIATVFLDSKTVVPIDKKLMGRNKKGQFNGKGPKSKHIFKNKADVMEYAKPVYITAKNAKAIVFSGKDGKSIFIRKPNGVNVLKPGGSYVKGAYSTYFNKWFSNPANINSAILKSSYITTLESQLAKYLSKANSKKAVGLAVISHVSNMYSRGVVEV